ncbi:hypothetical protein [Clostridium cellulovorans]|nr:hypothetical protein [Clostridium cellulovorans]
MAELIKHDYCHVAITIVIRNRPVAEALTGEVLSVGDNFVRIRETAPPNRILNINIDAIDYFY